jgi:hypothetical protein
MVYGHERAGLWHVFGLSTSRILNLPLGIGYAIGHGTPLHGRGTGRLRGKEIGGLFGEGSDPEAGVFELRPVAIINRYLFTIGNDE